MTAPLVFVDTETTSLADDRRAWEVAIIRVEPDDVTRVGRGITLYVADVDLSRADAQALAIGRFYERHPRYADTPKDPRVPMRTPALAAARHERSIVVAPEREVARLVERWTRGAIVVGSNPGFDTRVLASMLRHHGLTPAWHYRPIDVAALAAGYLYGRFGEVPFDGPGVLPATTVDVATFADAPPVRQIVEPWQLDTPWSSEALSRAVGLPPAPESERHTAMGDARWVQRLYNLITRGRVIPALPAAEAEPVGGAA